MKKRLLLLCCMLMLPLCQAAPTADIANAKDPDGMPRYGGSVIFGYQHAAFDESVLPLAKANMKDGVRGFDKTQRVEGKRTRVLYLAPEGRSSLEVLRNYTEALGKSGYTALFECANEACGKDMQEALYFSNKSNRIVGKQITEYAFTMGVQDVRLFVGEQKQASGSNYVLVLAAISGNAADNSFNKRVTVYLEQVQAGKMASRMETLKSSEIQQALNRDGRVAIYGVLFDTDKADVKPESKAQLDEMGRFLQQNPAVTVFVVGHTDNQGKLDHNLSLSQRRAESVVNALAEQYKIARSRLLGKGIANLAPVAPNQMEEGRAKNRRVELVLQ